MSGWAIVHTSRQEVIEFFDKDYPKPCRTPHYAKVKKEHPMLYLLIMRKFNGYRAFLRVAKRPMPPTSAKERAFIKYSSNVSRRYYQNEWSSLEEWTFGILVVLGHEDGFIHNFPFPSPKKSYYKLDFYDPICKLDIEVDGIFHTAIPGQDERDRFRDSYIHSFNIKVLRLTTEDFKDMKVALNKVARFLRKANENKVHP